MLRLLFTTAAILPIAGASWMTSKAKTLGTPTDELTFAEQVVTPNIEALSECRPGEVPVFFHDALITTHSAQSINEGIQVAESCGGMTVTVIPVVPTYADRADLEQSDIRTTELLAHIGAAAEQVNAPLAIELIDQPREEDISTLYINGRAAILRIDPAADAG